MYIHVHAEFWDVVVVFLQEVRQNIDHTQQSVTCTTTNNNTVLLNNSPGLSKYTDNNEDNREAITMGQSEPAVKEENDKLHLLAEANRKLEIKKDKTGKFKRKSTKEDDNRISFDNSEVELPSSKHRTLPPLSNIIFLPDKSKGASPKRYGPKRLGSVPRENLPAISESSTESSSLSCNSDTDSVTNDISSEAVKRSESMTVLCSPNQSDESPDTQSPYCKLPEIKGPFDHSEEQFTFIEDHFGLETGSIASGISPSPVQQMPGTNQAEDPNNVNTYGTEQPQTEIIPDNSFRPWSQENHDSRKQCEILHSVDRHTSSPDLTQNTTPKSAKFPQSSHRLKRKRDKSKRRGDHQYKDRNVLEQSVESEEIQLNEEPQEICEKCRETKDLCGCIIFCKETRLMFAFCEERPKPLKAYERFCKLGKKELPWSELKSKQAVFAKELKASKTSIFQDNRICLEFYLPSYKGADLETDTSKVEEMCNKSLAGFSKSEVKTLDSVMPEKENIRCSPQISSKDSRGSSSDDDSENVFHKNNLDCGTESESEQCGVCGADCVCKGRLGLEGKYCPEYDRDMFSFMHKIEYHFPDYLQRNNYHSLPAQKSVSAFRLLANHCIELYTSRDKQNVADLETRRENSVESTAETDNENKSKFVDDDAQDSAFESYENLDDYSYVDGRIKFDDRDFGAHGLNGDINILNSRNHTNSPLERTKYCETDNYENHGNSIPSEVRAVNELQKSAKQTEEQNNTPDKSVDPARLVQDTVNQSEESPSSVEKDSVCFKGSDLISDTGANQFCVSGADKLPEADSTDSYLSIIDNTPRCGEVIDVSEIKSETAEYSRSLEVFSEHRPVSLHIGNRKTSSLSAEEYEIYETIAKNSPAKEVPIITNHLENEVVVTSDVEKGTETVSKNTCDVESIDTDNRSSETENYTENLEIHLDVSPSMEDPSMMHWLKAKKTEHIDDNRVVIFHEIKEYNVMIEPESEEDEAVEEEQDIANFAASGYEQNSLNKNEQIVEENVPQREPPRPKPDDVQSQVNPAALRDENFERNSLHNLGLHHFLQRCLPFHQWTRIPEIPESATSDFARSLWESAEQGLGMPVDSDSSRSSSSCSDLIFEDDAGRSSAGSPSPAQAEAAAGGQQPESMVDELQLNEPLEGRRGQAEVAEENHTLNVT